MVEGILVDRGLERLSRSSIHYKRYTPLIVELSISPWPCLSTILFTFDVEGSYGGGKFPEYEDLVIKKVLKLMNSGDVKGTFNVLGQRASEIEDILQSIHKSDHEIATHGYYHIMYDELSLKEQYNQLLKGKQVLEEMTGEPINGCRVPFAVYNRHTYEAIDRIGFLWSSNWSRSLWGTRPFRPEINGQKFKVIEVPFDDIHYDAALYRWESPPSEVGLLWKNYVKRVAQNAGTFHTFLFHPVNASGKDGVLEDRIDAIKVAIAASSSEDLVWTPSLAQLTSRFRFLENVVLTRFEIKMKENEFMSAALNIDNRNESSVNRLVLIIKYINKNLEITSEAKDKVVSIDQEFTRTLGLHIGKIPPKSSVKIEINLEREK